MKHWIAALILAPAIVCVSPAFSPSAHAEETTASARAEFVPMPGVEYYCTDADGARVELGQIICITAGCQTWMAKCDMSLNVTTWRKTQDGCLGASLADRLKLLKPAV